MYPDGSKVSYTYDVGGNRLSMDDSGGTTSYTYNKLNRLTSVTDSGARTTTYAYDGVGNRVRVTTVEGVMSYVYDENNRVSSLTNPDGDTTTYQYDRVGNQLRVDYSNGTYTEYTHNKSYWLTSLANKKGDTVLSSFEYTYDKVGNRLSVKEQDASVVSYGYDGLYRLREEERRGTNAYEGSYTYDSVGNRLTREETKEVIPKEGTANFDPDTFNINSSGKWVTVYLTPMPASADKAWITAIDNVSIHAIKAERMEADNAKFNTRSVGEASKAYTGENVTYSIVWLVGGKLYQGQTDQVRIIEKGEPSKKAVPEPTDDLPPTMVKTTTTDYTYNEDNQLISSITDGETTTYAYDGNGNQVSKDEDGVVTSYEYDFENRLIGVSSPTGTTEYAYDGDGNRVSKIDASGTINYVNDVNQPLVQVLMEEDEGGNVLASYTVGNDLISRRNHTTDETQWYHYDGLGSTRQLTDSASTVVAEYVYDAWGNVLSSTETTGNTYAFTGEQQFREADGLVFLRARYLDTGIGRFIGRDPLAGLTYYPNSLNRYVYVGNNPINHTDPSGLQPTCINAPTCYSAPECVNLKVGEECRDSECPHYCVSVMELHYGFACCGCARGR